MAKTKLAFFGGGFNPPHIAHVMSVVYAQTMGGFDQIRIIPCWHHAFAKDSGLISFDQRAKMCHLAFEDTPNVLVDCIEQAIQTRYTIDLMEHLRKVYHENHYDLSLIIGSDNLQVMHSWHRWQDLGGLVNFFVLPRPGSSELPFVMPDVSSTEVREAIKNGNLDTARSMVPPKVMDYIVENKLYL